MSILGGFPRKGIYPDIGHFFENFGCLLWPRTLFSTILGRFCLINSKENPNDCWHNPCTVGLPYTEIHANIAQCKICVKFSTVQCSPVKRWVVAWAFN